MSHRSSPLRSLATALAITATTAVATGGAAGAAHADAGSVPNQRVDIVFVGDTTAAVVARGVVDDTGTAQELTTFDPGGVTFHGTLVLRLRRGTINAPFRGAITGYALDPASCTVSFTTAGEFTAGTSTGAYAGITGVGTFTERGTSVLHRHHDGTCGAERFRLLRTLATATLERA